MAKTLHPRTRVVLNDADDDN